MIQKLFGILRRIGSFTLKLLCVGLATILWVGVAFLAAMPKLVTGGEWASICTTFVDDNFKQFLLVILVVEIGVTLTLLGDKGLQRVMSNWPLVGLVLLAGVGYVGTALIFTGYQHDTALNNAFTITVVSLGLIAIARAVTYIRFEVYSPIKG